MRVCVCVCDDAYIRTIFVLTMAKVHGAKDGGNLCTMFVRCSCAFNAIARVLGGFRVGANEAKKNG